MPVARCGLDVELAAPQLGKKQIVEEPRARLEQELAFERTDCIRAHHNFDQSLADQG
jgi:hypothetical protein